MPAYIAPWLTDYQPASWRGQYFAVESTRKTGGQKTIVHEYWGRDEPWIEFAGMANQVISVRGFLIGDDVFLQRELFEFNASLPGAGELVLPSFGSINCSLVAFSTGETFEEGRVCSLEMNFIPSSQQIFPGLTPLSQANTQSAVFLSASNSWAASAQDFFSDVKAGLAYGERIVNSVLAPIQQFVNTAESIVHDATRTINAVKGLGVLLGAGSTFGRYSSGHLSSGTGVLGTVNSGLGAINLGLSEVTRVENGVTSVLSAATTTATAVTRAGAGVANLVSLL